MVRQDWASWNLDIALPMLYHNFYNQNLNWIQFSAEQGIREAHDRFEIMPGLYIPSLTPDELKVAISKSVNAGSVGISVFDISAMTDEHWQTLLDASTMY